MFRRHGLRSLQVIFEVPAQVGVLLRSEREFDVRAGSEIRFAGTLQGQLDRVLPAVLRLLFDVKRDVWCRCLFCHNCSRNRSPCPSYWISLYNGFRSK